MDSSRLHAALDAIYTCCTPAGSLEESLKAIDMSPSDTALVSRLAAWVLNVAPLGPLPMSPDEAIALAERVHKNMGAR
ncbi:hypothetical protein [Paraburkholderia phenoliruptrix]|uniref:hypothetical protein n=1 Tax=Paraburkholderia phenoliruptrix TaxID=252970 RepID=UPI002869EA12|nr:hypothetical protein [Paraburkholderia phenoliruptrix]WMY08645.1 hypothetical protein P3F88_02385 [Paraburkholderia phenoliruptrix]